jgi:hypothetical protein
MEWPYNVALFGGEVAQFLPNFIGITVCTPNVGRIYGIKFNFNKEVNGSRSLLLGRRGPFSQREPRLYDPSDGLTDMVSNFDIDGPRGERINLIEQQQTTSGENAGFRVSRSLAPSVQVTLCKRSKLQLWAQYNLSRSRF